MYLHKSFTRLVFIIDFGLISNKINKTMPIITNRYANKLYVIIIHYLISGLCSDEVVLSYDSISLLSDECSDVLYSSDNGSGPY